MSDDTPPAAGGAGPEVEPATEAAPGSEEPAPEPVGETAAVPEAEPATDEAASESVTDGVSVADEPASELAPVAGDGGPDDPAPESGSTAVAGSATGRAEEATRGGSGDEKAEEATRGGSGPGGPGRRTVSLQAVVTAVAVLVAVVAVVFALAQRSDAGKLSDEADARADVAAAAGRFGEVYLSYDTDDVAASSERVLELVSAEFARDFQSNRAPGVEEIFANLGTTTTAETTETFVGSVTDERASVLVVVDVEAHSDASGTQVLSDLSFLLDLVREDGRWVVDNVLPAPQPDITGDGVGDPTTTTTAPPAP